jgi:hypothetical protein
VRPGAGANGSTRIEFVWPDNSIRDTWIQVTVNADATTGLSAPDVFYFGNVIGESGNNSGDPVVDAADVQATIADPHSFLNPAPITNPHDYNRDGRVDATDQALAAANQTTSANAVHLIGYSTFAQLLTLAQNYGGPGTRAEGDYTGDGLINFSDLLVVAQSYLANPPAAATAQATAVQPDTLLTSRKPRPATAPRLALASLESTPGR